MHHFELSGPAQKLCVYIGESDSWRSQPLYLAVLEVLRKQGLAGATVIRGVAGFGAHSRAIHTAAILRLSQDLPLRIEVVDTPEQISKALDAIEPMVGEGLITLEPVEVVRYTHRGLNPLPADRLVSEVMTQDVVAVRNDAPIVEAWHSMLQHGVKTLPVVDAQRKVVGLVTDDDLLERVGLRQRLSVAQQVDEAIIAEELNAIRASPLHVSEVMSHPAIVVRGSDGLGRAVRQMTKHGVKRLPVIDAVGVLIGVLSRVDLLRQVVEVTSGSPHLVSPSLPGRTLGEVMSPVVPKVRATDVLQAITEAFTTTGTHRLIVIDDEERVVGLISDADIIKRLPKTHHRALLSALRGSGQPPALALTAAELMSEGALTALPDTSVAAALQLMMPPGRKWIVVVDEAAKPLGLVDRATLLAALAGT